MEPQKSKETTMSNENKKNEENGGWASGSSPLPGSAYDVVIPDVIQTIKSHADTIGFSITITRENWRTVLRELCESAKAAAEMREDLRDIARLNAEE